MKQSNNQKVNIIINNEIKKTRRKRKYVKKPIEENNSQLTAYNPNVLSKVSSVPSYGLKSVNPIIDNSLGLTNLLIDKIKQPEPTIAQYTNHIKPEPTITPIKEEQITPIQRNNINEFNITPKRNMFIPEEDEIQPTEDYFTDITNTSAVDEALNEGEIKKSFFSRFKNYVSPFKQKSGPGRKSVPLEDKSLDQLADRLRYLVRKSKEKNLSTEEETQIKKLREMFNKK